MADPTDGSTGQGLADLFGGVNRPQLNSFIATSQARNGLVSAQTQDAMIKASQAQEQMEAKAKYKADLIANGAPESEAQLITDAAEGANNGDMVTGLKAAQQAKLMYGNAQSQIQGQQGAEGKVATPPAVSNNYLPVPGTPGTPGAPAYAGVAPVQSPEGAAQTADVISQTHLRNAQTIKAATPAQGSLDDNAAYNAAVKYNQWGVLPALGMGSAGAEDRRKILSWAANLSVNPTWTPPAWSAGSPPAGPSPGGPSPGVVPPGVVPPGVVPPGIVPPGITPPVHPTPQTAANASANPADAKAQQAMLIDQTKRTATADTSEQTALKQMDIVRGVLSKADQTGVPYANSIVNKVRQGLFGDPNVSAYQNALHTMRTEYARVISLATGAAGITDYAAQQGQKLFPDDLAPAQFESNAAVARDEMGARTGSMHATIAQAKSSLHTPIGGVPQTPQAPAAIPLDAYLKSKGF